MMKQTHEPFPKAMRKLLKERDLSQRELARQLKRHKGPHISTLNFMVQGDIKPSVDSMEAIGRALKLAPSFFAEYRLAKARDSLDPDVVGMRAALGTLAKLEQ